MISLAARLAELYARYWLVVTVLLVGLTAGILGETFLLVRAARLENRVSDEVHELDSTVQELADAVKAFKGTFNDARPDSE